MVDASYYRPIATRGQSSKRKQGRESKDSVYSWIGSTKIPKKDE